MEIIRSEHQTLSSLFSESTRNAIKPGTMLYNGTSSFPFCGRVESAVSKKRVSPPCAPEFK